MPSSNLIEPRWIELAKRHVGLSETKGAEHSAEILQFWKDIKRGGIKDDETPWCAAFVGAMLERSGIKSSRFESAASYANHGSPLFDAVYGCIVVFTRSGGGHVGFVVGKTDDGKLLVLGGNQSDAVNIRAFGTDRVVAYRWPSDTPPPIQAMPTGHAETSRTEA